jgi:hypothetical protein
MRDKIDKFKKENYATKYFKAEWYIDALTRNKTKFVEAGQYSAAYEIVKLSVAQKSEYEDENAIALNSAAWFLATCKDPRFRDANAAFDYSTKAVLYARKANETYYIASYLHTMAAVYAEKGDFSKATALETEAYNIAPDKNSGVPLAHLNSFKDLIWAY